MPSPLFNLLGGNSPLGNMQAVMAQFNQFRNAFRGDPEQTVNQLLKNGRFTQDQVDQAMRIANQMKGMLPK